MGYNLNKKYGLNYYNVALDYVRGNLYTFNDEDHQAEDSSDKSFIGNLVNQPAQGIVFVSKGGNGGRKFPSSYNIHDGGVSMEMGKFKKNDFDAIMLVEEVTSIYDHDSLK